MRSLATMSPEYQLLLTTARDVREQTEVLNPMLHVLASGVLETVSMTGFDRDDWERVCAASRVVIGGGEWAAWTADAYVKIMPVDGTPFVPPMHGQLEAEHAAGVENVVDAMTVTLLRVDGSVESGFWPYMIEGGAIRWGQPLCNDGFDGYIHRCLNAALGVRS